MKLKHVILLTMAVAMVMTACEMQDPEPEVSIDDLKKTFQEMEDRYAKFDNAGQYDSLRFYYADNVISYGSEEPEVRGLDNVIAMIKSNAEEDDQEGNIRFEVLDVFAAGDHATEIGRSLLKKGNDPEVHTGNYICVFEKQADGSWAVIREMYNDRMDDDADSEEEGEGMPGGEE